MTSNGSRSENHQWIDVLLDLAPCGYALLGKDPMEIDLDKLSASGHPPRRTSALVSAMGDIPGLNDIREYADIRQHCLGCAETVGEVRKCAVIACPFWAYRMGRNPHNPKRGELPSFAKKLPVTSPVERAKGKE
jgi:hypothetical protein